MYCTILHCTERARTAKLVGASQECQVVIFTDSVFTPSEKAAKNTDIVYTDSENKAFVTDMKKMKGDDMFLSEVLTYCCYDCCVLKYLFLSYLITSCVLLCSMFFSFLFVRFECYVSTTLISSPPLSLSPFPFPLPLFLSPSLPFSSLFHFLPLSLFYHHLTLIPSILPSFNFPVST